MAIEALYQDAVPRLAQVGVDVSRRDDARLWSRLSAWAPDGSHDGRHRQSDELADAFVPMDDTRGLRLPGLLKTSDRASGVHGAGALPAARWMPFGTTMKLDRRRLASLRAGATRASGGLGSRE